MKRNDARQQSSVFCRSCIAPYPPSSLRRHQGIEGNCLEMERHIENIKIEKDKMGEEVIEAEKQVMLWQRKIHLEQEMQQALDPSVGELETTAMKKEIHRMQLRLEQLKRRQEQIIVEMERAVYKRDSIQMKYWNQQLLLPPQSTTRLLGSARGRAAGLYKKERKDSFRFRGHFRIARGHSFVHILASCDSTRGSPQQFSFECNGGRV